MKVCLLLSYDHGQNAWDTLPFMPNPCIICSPSPYAMLDETVQQVLFIILTTLGGGGGGERVNFGKRAFFPMLKKNDGWSSYFTRTMAGRRKCQLVSVYGKLWQQETWWFRHSWNVGVRSLYMFLSFASSWSLDNLSSCSAIIAFAGDKFSCLCDFHFYIRSNNNN